MSGADRRFGTDADPWLTGGLFPVGCVYGFLTLADQIMVPSAWGAGEAG